MKARCLGKTGPALILLILFMSGFRPDPVYSLTPQDPAHDRSYGTTHNSAHKDSSDTSRAVDRFQVWGGYQIPTDSRFKDVYGGCPEAGASFFLPATSWGGVELGAAYRWGSGEPDVGPFVKNAEIGWHAVPVTLSYRFDRGSKPIRQYGRLGVVVQWNKESYKIDVAGLKIDRSATQWCYGIAVGGGFLSSGRTFNLFSDLQWIWLPCDRIEITGVETNKDETRKIGEMNLGGFLFRLGVAF